MQRLWTKVATGLAPDGRLYAGDVNQLQDVVAALSDFAQIVGLNRVEIGDSTLAIVKYGNGEIRLTGGLRLDTFLRIFSSFYLGQMTDVQRDALPSTQRDFGAIVQNQTRGRVEWNAGTSGIPKWFPIAVDINGNLIMPAGGAIIFSNGTTISGEKPPISIVAEGEHTSDVIVTANTEGSATVIVPAAPVTITTAATMEVTTYVARVNIDSGGPGDTTFVLFSNGAPIGILSRSSMTQGFGYGSVKGEFSRQYAAGTYSFDLRMYLTGIGQATVKCGPGGPGVFVPAKIRVERK